MAYNFLGLVNDVCAKLNETQLTSSNFSTSLGIYENMKDSVNAAIRDINQMDFEWPFNHVQQEDTLAAGDFRVPLPLDCKTVDWDSFKILRDDTIGNVTKKLKLISYEKHQDLFLDNEYNTATSIRGIPLYVARTPSQEYIFDKPLDAAYTVGYEYYRLQVDLENYQDVPMVPESFRHIIVEGAMYHMELFRADKEAALIHSEKFKSQIKDMKRIYTTRIPHIIDTRINVRTTGFIDIE